MMDKSYIVRTYQQAEGTAAGIVEDIEQNKRTRFGNAEELWKLVAKPEQENSTNNVINLET